MKNESGKTFLMLGNEKLGVLTDTSVDMFWNYGKFHPLPPFEKYKSLFEQLEVEWNKDYSEHPQNEDSELSEHRNLAYEIQEQVENLGLTVLYSSGKLNKIRDFKIQDGMFEYKDVLD